jgi:Lon protease-like protein
MSQEKGREQGSTVREARKELPERPSLEHLKSQAKDLLEGVRSGAPEALERVRHTLPAARNANAAKIAQLQLALHDAQSVIAREYGFASWAELKAAVERVAAAGATGALSPESLRALLARVASTPPPAEVQQSLLEASSLELQPLLLPAELPVVPLRNTLLAVGAVAPLLIGRASSLAALDAAQRDNARIALFGQKEELDEAPGSASLHPVGCVGAVHALFPVPGQQMRWLVVKALQWVSLAQLTSVQPYLRARVERFEVDERTSDETRQLEQELRQRVRSFTATLPDGDRLQKLTDGMSALQLADACINNLPCSLEARATYAAQRDLTSRLRHVIALFP